VTGWRQRPNGVKYVAFDHPLAPRYKDTKGGGLLPVHPQPGGIGYRDWVAIALGDVEGTRLPARSITDWYVRSQNVEELSGSRSRLFAAGYDMDNMKARGFVESEMWLPGTDAEATKALAGVARRLVAAAEIAAQSLRRAVREALHSRDAKADSAPLASVYEAFWGATHDRFFELVRNVRADGAPTLTALAPDWRRALRKSALDLFDEAAPLDPSVASFDPKRVVEARRNLVFTLEGYGLAGTKLFAELLLPSPQAKQTSQRKGRKAT